MAIWCRQDTSTAVGKMTVWLFGEGKIPVWM